MEAFEQEVAEVLGCEYAIAVSSGTAAIHIAMIILKRKIHELLVPIFNFQAIENIGKREKIPVSYLDVHPETLQQSYFSLPCNLGSKIMPMYLGGSVPEFPKFPENILLEDACHAFGARYPDGSLVGSGRIAPV